MESRQGISHRQNLSLLWFKWNMFRVKSKFEWWQTKLGNFGNWSSSFCFFFFHLQCNFKLDNKLLIFVEIIGKKLLRYRAVFNLQASTHTHTSLSLSFFTSVTLASTNTNTYKHALSLSLSHTHTHTLAHTLSLMFARSVGSFFPHINFVYI